MTDTHLDIHIKDLLVTISALANIKTGLIWSILVDIQTGYALSMPVMRILKLRIHYKLMNSQFYQSINQFQISHMGASLIYTFITKEKQNKTNRSV